MTAQLCAALDINPFADRHWRWISVCGQPTQRGTFCGVRVKHAGDPCRHHSQEQN